MQWEIVLNFCSSSSEKLHKEAADTKAAVAEDLKSSEVVLQETMAKKKAIAKESREIIKYNFSFKFQYLCTFKPSSNYTSYFFKKI